MPRLSFRISRGAEENGVVIGNAYDKYGSNNKIVKHLMRGFEAALTSLVESAQPQSIHEIGCGEGYWTMQWLKKGLQAKGCDFSEEVINIARENARTHDLPANVFKRKSIYDLCPEEDTADLIVCCEVLEHLEEPKLGLGALQRIASRNIIISVPNEPVWRMLNLARGKYIGQLGNTPGHIQHWSTTGIRRLVGEYFQIIETRTPLPWTMLYCQRYE